MSIVQEIEKYTANYSYDELKRKFPPEGVDIRCREVVFTVNSKSSNKKLSVIEFLKYFSFIILLSYSFTVLPDR